MEIDKWFDINGRKVAGCGGSNDSVCFHTEDGLTFTVTAKAYSSIGPDGRIEAHPSLELTVKKNQ